MNKMHSSKCRHVINEVTAEEDEAAGIQLEQEERLSSGGLFSTTNDGALVCGIYHNDNTHNAGRCCAIHTHKISRKVMKKLYSEKVAQSLVENNTMELLLVRPTLMGIMSL